MINNISSVYSWETEPKESNKSEDNRDNYTQENRTKEDSKQKTDFIRYSNNINLEEKKLFCTNLFKINLNKKIHIYFVEISPKLELKDSSIINNIQNKMQDSLNKHFGSSFFFEGPLVASVKTSKKSNELPYAKIIVKHKGIEYKVKLKKSYTLDKSTKFTEKDKKIIMIFEKIINDAIRNEPNRKQYNERIAVKIDEKGSC